MKSTAILIPARYHSTRFPGKPLVNLGGKPMIQRVAEICKYTGLDTFVLTDNKIIAQAVSSVGVKTYIDTIQGYNNGTERCSGAMRSEMFDGYDQFINVQCDMPDIRTDIIMNIMSLLQVYSVCTLYSKMDPAQQLDPNIVKIIHNKNIAHWFGKRFTYGDRHLGIYGYSRYVLTEYMRTPQSKYEVAENLEQLRWYKGGLQIGVNSVEYNGIEINTPEDAKKWNASF